MCNCINSDINPKATKIQIKVLIKALDVLLSETTYLTIRLVEDLVKLRSVAKAHLDRLNRSK